MSRNVELPVTHQEPRGAAAVVEEAPAEPCPAAKPPEAPVEPVTPYDELWFRCRPGSP